jgi:hypothetical protein
MKPPEMIGPGFPCPRILALMSASPHSVRERARSCAPHLSCALMSRPRIPPVPPKSPGLGVLSTQVAEIARPCDFIRAHLRAQILGEGGAGAGLQLGARPTRGGLPSTWLI